VWGAYFLAAHGAIGTLWLAAGWFGFDGVITALTIPAVVIGILATSYTGFLFAQGLGRDLWQGPSAAIDLIAQSVVAGAAALLVCAVLMGNTGDVVPLLGRTLAAGIGAHLVILLFEHLLSPSPTRHHELAVQTITRGAYSRMFWGAAIAGGGVLPVVMLLTLGVTFSAALTCVVALLALAGGAAWEYIWVEAGQSVPLS